MRPFVVPQHSDVWGNRQATPEDLAIESAGDELARHKQYVRLGIGVLRQAFQDATENVPEAGDCRWQFATLKQRTKWNRLRQERNQARAFLTTENPDLAFWCDYAGLHMGVVLDYAKRAKGRWEELGEAMRASKLHWGKAS
jgi:hypothetical protein